jgi:hypothetical protein
MLFKILSGLVKVNEKVHFQEQISCVAISAWFDVAKYLVNSEIKLVHLNRF